MDIDGPAKKLRDEGASIYAIGVGKACRRGEQHNCYEKLELETIASKPADQFVFEINNFDQLILKRIGILADVCEGNDNIVISGEINNIYNFYGVFFNSY